MVKEYELEPRHLHEIKNHTAVGDYFTINEREDGILLHDVVTLRPLKGTETPPGVLMQSELNQGLDYLRSRGLGKDILVQLILAPHSSAEDFTDLYARHGSVLEEAPVIALEMSSLRRDDTSQAIEPVLSEYTERRSFQEAQLAWASAYNKLVLPCELPVNDDSSLGRGLAHLWNEIFVPVARDRQMEPTLRNAATLIAEAAYQRSRQPSIIARLGSLLAQLDEQGKLPNTQHVPLIIGSGHKNDAHRFADIHVPVDIYVSDAEVYDDRTNRFRVAFMDMTHTSRASLEQLSTAVPYIDEI